MLLSASAVSLFAQSSLVATLSHEGEITAFYGASALQQAHEAATHGDVITLSSGSFLPVDITKAVTLRGAGMELDSVYNTLPTEVLGDFTIQIVDSTTEKLKIEGLHHNHLIKLRGKLSNAVFMKNRFAAIKCAMSSDEDNGILDKCIFANCKITDELRVTVSGTDCVLTNCYVNKFGYKDNSQAESTMSFSNCIVNSFLHETYPNGTSSARIDCFYNCSFLNCIIIGTGRTVTVNYATVFVDKLPLGATAYNCIAINCSGGCFGNISNATNAKSTYEEVFKDFTGTYTDATTFELTDEAKAAFLGTDGTQVGIYGGRMPYSPIPTNPRITKCDVAGKSTADGKLSVDIEVSGAE